MMELHFFLVALLKFKHHIFMEVISIVGQSLGPFGGNGTLINVMYVCGGYYTRSKRYTKSTKLIRRDTCP